MYKINKTETHSYLNDLLPSLVNDVSNYNLRNNTNYNLPFLLCSYETSYFSSTLKLWNDFNTETCNIPSLLQFKSSIRHQPPRVDRHLSVGERKYNIILTRIRHRCSSSSLFWLQLWCIRKLIMRQTACLVVNPIIVDGYASLFNCTTAVRASDPITASS